MKMFPVTLTKHGLSSTDDLAYEGRNINNHQRQGEHPITSVLSFRNLLPRKTTSLWHLTVPHTNPQGNILLTPFEIKRNHQRNTTFWAGPITYFSSYWSLYVLQNTITFLGYIFFCQATLLQCKRQPHRGVEWSQDTAFRMMPALDTAMTALITDTTTHTKQLSLICAYLNHAYLRH